MLQVKVAVCLDLESGILGPGRFRPGPPNSNNALLRAGQFILVGRTCFINLSFVLVHMTTFRFSKPHKATAKKLIKGDEDAQRIRFLKST